jgi:hypothetical protein
MAWISNRIAGIVENKAPLWWWIAIAITGSFAGFGTFCILYLLFTGVGVWGNNIPVGIFPAIHVGRIWMVWFLAPVPNPNWIWLVPRAAKRRRKKRKPKATEKIHVGGEPPYYQRLLEGYD